MKTEQDAWKLLQRHAASRISPGFADRVTRLARSGAEAAPTLLSYCALSAVTAALCLAAVALFSPSATAETRDRGSWEQIIQQAEELASNS